MSDSSKIQQNQDLWDVWTPLNRDSDMYDVSGFLAGKSTLTEADRAVVGPVDGRSLLHLQCHFGMDSLSWAREGAKVTGVDFSQAAIDAARGLAAQAKLPADFHRATIGSVHEVLSGQQFDVVYTSYGVLSWLSDLQAWANDIACLLAPGGCFHIVEFHPTLGLFDDDGRTVAYSYFREDEPLFFEETESYSGGEHPVMACYQWTHSLADIFQALLRAGLTISAFHEYPYCFHRCYPYLVESEPGRYVMRDHPGKIPMLFSISAHR